MSNSPSQDEIISALKRSGYLMEQEAATQLEALGFHVQTNRAFKDSDEGKSRELDIHATKRVAVNEEKKIAAYVEIMAECKNSKNPFVFIGRPKNQTDNRRAPHEYIFPIRRYIAQKDIGAGRMELRETEAFFHLGFDKIHHSFLKNDKAVQFCRIDRNGKNWEANHGGLYDAIFYPIAKAITARKLELPRNDRHSDWRYFWFLVPMVVLSGEMFYVDSASSEPEPAKADYVTFRRQLRSENLDGIFTVDFVRQEYLERFVSDKLGPLSARMEDLICNQADFVLTSEIPWQD